MTIDAEDAPERHERLAILRESLSEAFHPLMVGFARAVLRDPPRAEDVRSAQGPEPPAVVHVATEVVLELGGDFSGYVVLRCSAHGPIDLPSGLLLMTPDEALAVEQVSAALGRCAALVAGVLARRAGDVELGEPRVLGADEPTASQRGGVLVYRLAQGVLAAEIWAHDPPGIPSA